MILETYIYNSLVNTKKQEINKTTEHWLKLYFVCGLKLICALIAGYLAWDCNKKSNIFIRFFYVIFASMFSFIYIIYYSVFRKVLGFNCN